MYKQHSVTYQTHEMDLARPWEIRACVSRAVEKGIVEPKRIRKALQGSEVHKLRSKRRHGSNALESRTRLAAITLRTVAE